MATSQRPERSTDARIAVPTVAKLRRVKRCTATAQAPLRHQQCPIYADTALDGRPLCRQHLAEELLPDCVQRAGEPGEDATRTRAVLREVREVLRAGVPDPLAPDQLLAVVPAALIERIEDALGQR